MASTPIRSGTARPTATAAPPWPCRTTATWWSTPPAAPLSGTRTPTGSAARSRTSLAGRPLAFGHELGPLRLLGEAPVEPRPDAEHPDPRHQHHRRVAHPGRRVQAAHQHGHVDHG